MSLRRAAAASLAWLGLTFAPAEAQKSDRPVVVTTLTLFAGTEQGLYRSQNWGLDWQRLQHPGLTGVGAVYQVVPLGPRIYAGGDGGLYISDDFGDTWTRALAGTAVLSVLSSRYPTADPTVVLGTSEGLVRSLDGGLSFRAAGLRGTAIHQLEWPGPAMVLATSGGVRVSSDAARTLSEPGVGLPQGPVCSLVLSSFFSIDPVLFAAVQDQGLWRSPDGGKNWTTAGLAGQTVTGLVWLGPFLYAAGDQGVQRSEDLGKNWTPLNDGLKGVLARQLLFPLAPAAGAEAFLATDDGVFHTADGGLHWTGPRLKGTKVLTLATFPPPQSDPLQRRR